MEVFVPLMKSTLRNFLTNGKRRELVLDGYSNICVVCFEFGFWWVILLLQIAFRLLFLSDQGTRFPLLTAGESFGTANHSRHGATAQHRTTRASSSRNNSVGSDVKIQSRHSSVQNSSQVVHSLNSWVSSSKSSPLSWSVFLGFLKSSRFRNDPGASWHDPSNLREWMGPALQGLMLFSYWITCLEFEFKAPYKNPGHWARHCAGAGVNCQNMICTGDHSVQETAPVVQFWSLSWEAIAFSWDELVNPAAFRDNFHTCFQTHV